MECRHSLLLTTIGTETRGLLLTQPLSHMEWLGLPYLWQMCRFENNLPFIFLKHWQRGKIVPWHPPGFRSIANLGTIISRTFSYRLLIAMYMLIMPALHPQPSAQSISFVLDPCSRANSAAFGLSQKLNPFLLIRLPEHKS